MPATNLGRSVNLISGVNGVSTGGQGVWLPPLNRRYHRHTLKTTGIALAGGTGLACTAVTSTNGGTGLEVTVTVTAAGAVNTAVVTSGHAGANWSVGDTFVWADPNYPTSGGYTNPVLCTVATVSSGAVSTFTFASTAVPTNPTLVLGTVRQLVAGTVMRDITPAQTLGIIAANPLPKGYSINAGELPILYTEPWRNVLRRNDQNSWDLALQPSYEIDLGVSAGVTSPAVAGNMEFDYQRNTMTVNGKTGVVLSPIKHKAFTIPIPAGQYDWTTLPINFPISRIWLAGSTPGAVTRLEVYQDGNKVMESYTPEITEMYGAYGFTVAGLNNVAPGNGPQGWDAAYIADPDQRYGKYLICSNSLIVRIYSNSAQNMTAVLETAPGAYL